MRNLLIRGENTNTRRPIMLNTAINNARLYVWGNVEDLNGGRHVVAPPPTPTATSDIEALPMQQQIELWWDILTFCRNYTIAYCVRTKFRFIKKFVYIVYICCVDVSRT